MATLYCAGTPQRGGDVATPLQPSLASDMPYRSEERSERSGPTSRDLWQHRPDPFPALVPQLRPRSPDAHPPDFARDRHRNFAQSLTSSRDEVGTRRLQGHQLQTCGKARSTPIGESGMVVTCPRANVTLVAAQPRACLIVIPRGLVRYRLNDSLGCYRATACRAYMSRRPRAARCCSRQEGQSHGGISTAGPLESFEGSETRLTNLRGRLNHSSRLNSRTRWLGSKIGDAS